jgi:hypothetical protein
MRVARPRIARWSATGNAGPGVATRALPGGRQVDHHRRDGSGREGYYLFGSDKLYTKHRGKLGASVLFGGATNGGDSLEWVLTTHDYCGDFCDDFFLEAAGLSD